MSTSWSSGSSACASSTTSTSWGSRRSRRPSRRRTSTAASGCCGAEKCDTGVRFKFQTIIQRYSTFHSYWMRVVREIENGTYKRHVQRAKRRFGEDPTAPPKVDAAREAPS